MTPFNPDTLPRAIRFAELMLDEETLAHSHDVLARVAEDAPNDTDVQAVAILHDVIEDTTATLADVATFVSPMLVERLSLLTHPPGMSYNDYIERFVHSGDYGAAFVKFHDLSANYARNERGSKRFQKYQRALERITPFVGRGVPDHD